MEQKASNMSTGRGSGFQGVAGAYTGSCGKGMMKKSASELALEEFVGMMMMITPPDPPFGDPLETDDGNPCFAPPTSAVLDPDSPFRTREIAHGNISSSGGLGVSHWDQYLMSRHSNTPIPNPTLTDSQSSIFVGSPMSVSKPNIRVDQGRDSGSSDDDDGEIEPGSCEQSADPNNKHSRRKMSNRESARRSRKRKQEHLAGLEIQVEHLRVENETLFEQLANATQQFHDAGTNNRVLISNVEALRAKVKLAEDMVTRGSFNCSLNHLLQSLNLQPFINTRSSISRNANVSPTVTIHGDNNSSYTATGSTITKQNSCIGVGNGDSGNSNMANGITSEAVSCVSDIWP
ncbi:basic leucine zipper 9 [Punica granatum]|uniref:Basic leucine zipper 9 n=2 Tax=Punica granatum TaxID=22663 RepID=A0A6P8BR10_PUNGR|nr:basic leucine zipper 9 [Punica granatum]PKI31276.1 hypothetical protein CRG98_048337 [Punica granatum]